MHDTTAIATPQTAAPKPYAGKNANPRYAELYRHYPTIDYLRRGARRRLPHFSFEYSDGGSGKDDAGIKRNWAALDAVELVPRYGVMPSLPPCEVELFGRRYAAPIGIAPMGGPAIVWPGADEYLARAAQRARIPYTLGTVGCSTIERIAELAPDVFWFQLYRAARNDHAIGFDLVRRAQAAGCHALVLTLDVPVRTTRAREVVVGLGGAFHPDLTDDAADADVAGLDHGAVAKRHSAFLQSARLCRRQRLDQRHGRVRAPRDGRRLHLGGGREISRPLERHADRQGHHASARCRESGVARRRRHVCFESRRPPDRGAAGADRRAAGDRQAGRQARHRDVDSGIRSGTDVVRAYALGAAAAFAGKAFLWGLGALGEEGAAHVIDHSHRGDPGRARTDWAR